MLVSARHRIPRLLVLAAVLLPIASPSRAKAGDPTPATTAVDKAPADVEVYGSFLRIGETVQTIGRSQAWQQLWADPQVKALWQKARESLAVPAGDNLFKFLTDPANAGLPALALDAVSNEIFFYTGVGTGDLLSLFQELLGGARYGPAFQKLLGGNAGDPNTVRLRILLQMLNEKPERASIPNMVLGFKVSDSNAVKAQLKRLDPVVAGALADTSLKGRSKRVKVDGDEFLVLDLDGSLVPWDMLPLGMFEEKEGEFAPLLKHLKAMKLTVAVGVRQGYLLVAIGSSTDHLAKFGGAGPKLASRPELKPLAAASGKPLTAVGYTSATFRQAIGTTTEDITGFADAIKALLENADLPENLRKGIEKDSDALFQSLAKEYVTKAGASLSFSVRTPRGWETFAHDYTPPAPGQARPLTLLNHLGGDPLMAAVWRSRTTVADYRALVKWAGIIAGHVEKVAIAKSPDAEPIVKMFQQEIVPVLKELSDITEKLWLPALADGQEGFVLDAKWTSKQWHAALPETDRPMPMPEIGIVVGVSDRAKLEAALEGYRAGVNKLVAKAQTLAPPGAVPEFEIPRPKIETKAGRTFAHYPIPPQLGLDEQFQPTGGLSDTVGVLTLSRGHANRLLTDTPFAAALTPFAGRKTADSVFYFNWAGIVDTAAPWVGFGIRTAAPEAERKHAEDVALKAIAALKLFREYGSVTYRAGGATVTHSEAVFQDLPPASK